MQLLPAPVYLLQCSTIEYSTAGKMNKNSSWHLSYLYTNRFVAGFDLYTICIRQSRFSFGRLAYT